MGGWLWKIYKDGNMDVPALQDHDSEIVGESSYCHAKILNGSDADATLVTIAVYLITEWSEFRL